MKSHSIFFIFIISTYTICTQSNEKKHMPSSVTISINSANQAHLNQQNDFNQQANHLAMQKTQITTQQEPNFGQKLYDFYKQQLQKSQQVSTSTITWINNNKIKTISAGLLITYSYIFYQIYQANLIINSPDSWSNWHNNRSLEDLFAIPQNKLESDLLFSIQTRYVHPVNPTDFIYSIVQSSISFNKEMQVLEDQILRYQRLKQCQSLPFFFIDAQELALLQDKHKKLSFIKHIFTSWCATYKIDKNI